MLPGARSGEYGGWRMVWIWFFTKNYCTAIEVWQAALRTHDPHWQIIIHNDLKRSVWDPSLVCRLLNVAHRSDVTIVLTLTLSSFLYAALLVFNDPAVLVVHSRCLSRLISIHCTETYTVSAANVPSLYNFLFDRCSNPALATYKRALVYPCDLHHTCSYMCTAEFRKLFDPHICVEITTWNFVFLRFWSSVSPYGHNFQPLRQDTNIFIAKSTLPAQNCFTDAMCSIKYTQISADFVTYRRAWELWDSKCRWLQVQTPSGRLLHYSFTTQSSPK
jgi:hypothetical protein